MSNPDSTTMRNLALGAIALLITLLMLPNVLWLSHDTTSAAWIQALLLPAVLLTVLFAVLGNWPWLACLLLAPFALLAPLEAFYIATYHTPSTPLVIATILSTNAQETHEYFGRLAPVLAGSAVAAFALAVLSAWWAFHARLRWRGRTREWILMIAFTIPACSFVVGFVATSGTAEARMRTASAPITSVADAIQSGFPFGLFQRTNAFRNEWASMRNDARKLANFNFHAHRTGAQPNQRQVYVLVIGESSARDHWQLFGYDRPTNPDLSRLSNLVPIRRMVTSWPDTIAAVPILLTRKPVTSSRPGWHEPSFIPAMAEAGYQTWWISNQYPIGRYDSPVAMYAYEAQHVTWLNRTANWNTPGSYDEALVKPLHRALLSSNKDMFIVLHMMGSHMHYDFRYPPSFARFKPTVSSGGNDVTRDARIRNSYDNTILYTDQVLADVIGALKHTDAITGLWFESDHGELLPTSTCKRQGHGIGTWHEFEIPALFWYSNGYAAAFPQRVASLRANASRRALSGDTFATMLGMAGVDFPGLDHHRSLFSPDWRYRPRIVNQFWQSDFDHSIFGKQCGAVIPDSGPPASHWAAPDHADTIRDD